MTAKQVKDFILWLRKERITYSSIQIGGVTLDGVVDVKHAKPVDKPEPRASMWDRYGEELLKQPPTPADDVPDEAKVD